MTLSELNVFIQDAADNDDKAYRFSVYRQAQQVWHKAITTEHPDSFNPLIAQTAQAAQQQLRQTLAPPELLHSEQEAAETLSRADKVYLAAQQQLPDWQANFEALMGFSPGTTAQTVAGSSAR